MDFDRLKQVLETRGEKSFRAKQIIEAYGSGKFSNFAALKILPKDLREFLATEVPWMTFEVVSKSISKDGTRKIVCRLADGLAIESVLMAYDNGRHTVCVSSQVGCGMNCAFCATGKMGLKRHLTAFEIADQVAYFDQWLRAEKLDGVDNVVFMGMGEPFHNYDAVAASIKLLQDPKIYGLGWRRISVSTSGLIPQILRFAKEFPQVNLAVSLHAADDELRTKLMPINKAWPLKYLQKACLEYVRITKRKIFFEYLLLRGVNDSQDQAEHLAHWLSISPLFHLNLIKYHPIGHAADKAASPEKAEQSLKFKALSFDHVFTFGGWVQAAGFKHLTIRRTFGEDIEAACGQLVQKVESQAEKV